MKVHCPLSFLSSPLPRPNPAQKRDQWILPKWVTQRNMNNTEKCNNTEWITQRKCKWRPLCATFSWLEVDLEEMSWHALSNSCRIIHFMLRLREFALHHSTNVNSNYKQLMGNKRLYYFLLSLPTLWFHSTNKVKGKNLGTKYVFHLVKDWNIWLTHAQC